MHAFQMEREIGAVAPTLAPGHIQHPVPQYYAIRSGGPITTQTLSPRSGPHSQKAYTRQSPPRLPFPSSQLSSASPAPPYPPGTRCASASWLLRGHSSRSPRKSLASSARTPRRQPLLLRNLRLDLPRLEFIRILLLDPTRIPSRHFDFYASLEARLRWRPLASRSRLGPRLRRSPLPTFTRCSGLRAPRSSRLLVTFGI